MGSYKDSHSKGWKIYISQILTLTLDCKFARKLKNARQAAQYEIQSICKSVKPLISLLKQKERHYENAIKALLKEVIPRSLHESGHSQSSRSNQVPVSAGWRFFM